MLTDKADLKAVTPIVSILIPCFNSRKWLAETLGSCQSQTYSNIEVIVVDDGSSDGSAAIAERFSNADARFKTYVQPNKGAPAARNLAFSKSEGQFIQFLDADDTLPQNKVGCQMAILKGRQSSLISCPWTHYHDGASVSELLIRRMDSKSDPIEWLQTKFLSGSMNLISCWLTPRRLIEKAGPWNEALKCNQDGEFFARVLLNADKVLFTHETHALYRRENTSSVSRVDSTEKARSLLLSYELYEQHMLAVDSSEITRRALASNYIAFIYQNHPRHPELISAAWERVKALEVGQLPLIGGRNFRLIQKFLGVHAALWLRRGLRFR
ncbi:glycosyltransferase family 2 protein [Rhodopirellula baltica]|uniref:Glycosyl transferase family protein n=1 Tax=Rhodopirellula baltica SWK14 TaxID=993516 RepID=L7CJH0_RHOBT|nr:glycosyltransferase family A protein [Rhodopirellula baltica]ELP34399.1 glycosyl transferase family protein [Rhodopirellula baltica SWK14]